jgi:hypothetical protein
MSKPKSVNALARTIATLMVELTNHPKMEKVIDEAAHMAHTDGGVDINSTGDITIAIALLAREVAYLGDCAASDNRDHWEEEAGTAGTNDDALSVHDCEKKQKQYSVASEAFGNATLSIARAIGKLRDGMEQADLG